MHVVYFATRDEDGTLRQRIMRARIIDAWLSETDGPMINLVAPHGSQLTARVTAIRVQPDTDPLGQGEEL